MPVQKESVSDEIGRSFCRAHGREVCHDCFTFFSYQNRDAEEEAGLIKKKTPWEAAAEDHVLATTTLSAAEDLDPHLRPPEIAVGQARKLLAESKKELQRYALLGHDVKSAIRKALQSQAELMSDACAVVQALRKENSNASLEFNGAEFERLREQLASPPKSSSSRGAFYTCDYCKKSSTVELQICSRCKAVAYCSKTCQTDAWRGHKKRCKPWTKTKDPKVLPLSWEELEVLKGRPAEGRVLEVRAMWEDESTERQVFNCKDRLGRVRWIEFHTSREVPNLSQGRIIRWKNPRFHYTQDCYCGARIEDTDLANLTIT